MLAVLIAVATFIVTMIVLARQSDLDRRLAKLKEEVARLSDKGWDASGLEAAAAPVKESQTSEAPAPAASIPDKPAMGKVWDQGKAATVPEPPPTVAAPPEQRDVENTLASRWFVWVGGIAIALGGLLFVKYAHDNGLIPPMLRVVLGLLLAGALVAAGEWVRKSRSSTITDYVPAALSAAGIVIAFGVIYAAYALYDLISSALCFPALVAIGLAALWLSRRQGPLIAALGLVGSYMAPALVPSDHPSAWGFFAYLLVIVSAALLELRSRPWWWLGYVAIAGATAWSLLWMGGGFFDATHILPNGLFALALGIAAAAIPVGKNILSPDMGTLAEPSKLTPPMWIAICGIAAAAVILSGLVWQSGNAAMALILFALGMLAIAAFGWLREGMVAAPIASALITLLVLMNWQDVGFHEWAMDERGFWSTVPGLIEPPKFRNAMFLALAFFTGLGLYGTFRKAESRPYAALASGAAILFLFGTWARADFVLEWQAWAILGTGLAALLAGVADRVFTKSGAARPAEILLVGVALLLLFAFDRAIDGVWQTIAIAISAAAFAFVTRRLSLPWIGVIASGLATIAAARLFFGREFWGEPQNLPLGAHWIIYGYGLTAFLLWQGSRWLLGETFRRYRVALEGLALGLAIALVSLELRVLIGGGITKDDMSLLELSAHALAWLGAAYGLAYRQHLFSSIVSLWGARALLLASCAALLAGLTIRNPVITLDSVEGGMWINSLWLAYLAPVPLLALMARKLEALGLERLRGPIGVFALALLLTFVTLQVKRLFQTSVLQVFFVNDAESYATSLSWLVLAIAIFLAGIRLDRQNIRYGGLAVMVLTVFKVFVFDLADLSGLWRIASLMGLGLCLIGIGWVYTRFVQKPKVAG